jgi:hypothetical protein
VTHETEAQKHHRHLAVAGRHLHAAGIIGLGVPLAPELDPDHDGDTDTPGAAGDTDADAGPPATATARTAAVVTMPFAERFPSPEYPPASWFERPDWVDGWRAEHGYPAAVEHGQDGHQIMRLTVTDDGRVGGWWYERGVCIVDRTATLRPGAHQCWSPEPSPTGYARFHQQDVVVLDDRRAADADGPGGLVLLAGAVGNAGGHASETAAPSVAARHYADPGAQLLIVRLGDDERGGWLAGAVVPGVSYGDVAMLRRCALSGDWRWFQPDSLNPKGGYDSLGPTLVTRPGLALVRPVRAASAEHPDWRPDDEGVVARLAQVTPASNPLVAVSLALGAYGTANPALAIPLNQAATNLLSAAQGNAQHQQQMAARAQAALTKAAANATKAQQKQTAQHIAAYAKAVKAAAKSAKGKGGGGGGKKGGKGKGGGKGKKPPALKGHAGPTKAPNLPKGYHMVFGRLVGPDGHVVSGGGPATASVALARIAYSPDQPRDDHGRFGEGSGGGKSPEEHASGIRSVRDRVAALGREHFGKADTAKAENHMTAAMKAVGKGDSSSALDHLRQAADGLRQAQTDTSDKEYGQLALRLEDARREIAG